MNRTLIALFVLLAPQQAFAEPTRTLIYVGTENSLNGNAGMVTSQSTGVKSNNSIDPVGHAFALAEVNIAKKYVGIWENTQFNNPVVGPEFAGAVYGKALPGASGQLIGFLSRERVEGGVQVHVARKCPKASYEGLLVIGSGTSTPYNCSKIEHYGYLAP
jgi:hypothetical protein